MRRDGAQVMDRIDVDYTRISEDKSGAEAGVESQHDENADFAEEIGLSLARTYTDNDKSAFSGVERPEYRRLLADISAGLIRSVTVWHANRLHRNTDEVNAFIRLARKHDVKLYSTTKGEAYNLEKASGRKQLRDDTSAAEYESEHRGERVAIARKRQARNGDYGGGVRPYGWGVDTGRVRSVCVNPKAPAMERVYEDRAVLDMIRHNAEEAEEIRYWKSELFSGVSLAHLLRDLAERGVLTVSGKDGRNNRRQGKTVRHHGWNSQTVRQILTHPRTSGHAVYQGKIVRRNAFLPIIGEDERQALIAMFADPARKTSPGNTPKWLGSLIYRCGVCNDGTTMTVRKDGQGEFCYRCRVKGHCSWRAKRVDLYVENVLISILSRNDIASLLPRAASNVDVTALREEMVELDSRKRKAAQRWTLGTMDDAQLDTANATADQRIAAIRAEIAAATEESPLSPFAVSEDAERTYREMSLGRRRELLRYMLAVTLLPIGRGGYASRDLIQIERRKPGRPPAEAA